MRDDPTTRILAAIDGVRGDVSLLRVDMIERTDRLRADLDHLKAAPDRTRVDLMERIDRLHNTLSQVQQDITVNLQLASA